MEGEESILSIANFLEATKPVDKVGEGAVGEVLARTGSDKKEVSYTSDAKFVISSKDTVHKNNVIERSAKPSETKLSNLPTIKTRTVSSNSNSIVAKKSKPAPDHGDLSSKPTAADAKLSTTIATSSLVVPKTNLSINLTHSTIPILTVVSKVSNTKSIQNVKTVILSDTLPTKRPPILGESASPLASSIPVPLSHGSEGSSQSTNHGKSECSPIAGEVSDAAPLTKAAPGNTQPATPTTAVASTSTGLPSRPPTKPGVSVVSSAKAVLDQPAPTTTHSKTTHRLTSETTTTTTSSVASTRTVSSTQSTIPPSVSSTSKLPTKPLAATVQGSTTVCSASVPVSTLFTVTSQLNNDSPLHSTALLYLSPDSLRNLCDVVQALDLSGETDCTDVETLTLHRSVLNIQLLTGELVTWSTSDFLPLTNISCRVLHCHNLQKLVYKEPNLKDIILGKVGHEDFNQFDQLTDFYMGRGDIFICENTGLVIYLYHRIRNLSLKYVLTKLYNVYIKMKPIFKKTSTDPVYNTSVNNLSRLMSAQWEEQVELSEENGYDFDFLITILMYWKKAKDNPVKPIESESDTKNPTVSTNISKLGASPASPAPITIKEGSTQKVNFPVVTTPYEVTGKPKSKDAAEAASAPMISSGQETKQESKSVKVDSKPLPVPVKVETKARAAAVPTVKPPAVDMNIPAMKAADIPSSQVSVLSLHQLKTFLDQSTEPRLRVVKGVGHQAYKEFNNLVSSLQDMAMVIGDVNVKTLYFTIINFANHPVTAQMKQFEPLSNFSLKFEPFQDLKNLMFKDINIRNVVTKQLGEEVMNKFLQQVDKAVAGSDFVLADQESNIVLYHRFRNCVVDNLMTRLKVVHSKIQVVELTNPPAGYTIGVKMLESLMATHYNGQVLMMEKSKFDFDFLTTILEVLQQCKDSEMTQGGQEVKVVVKPAEKKNKLAPIISSILTDLADIGLVQGLENMIGADVCEEYIASVRTAESKAENLTVKEMKAVFSLKNSIFFFKNNLQCGDLPLTNLSLEAEKFSHLLKFIGKDAGIRTAINDKFGEVALRELEALVTAHDERGDQFISKFVEKNVKLYHSLRNTALEKILRQISVVHGKVKNIDLPEAARNSTQYHIAIRRLDSIVDSNFTKKILIIEDLKFEFDFLSTILLVWRTETSKQAEAALKSDEAKKGAEVAKLSIIKPVEVKAVKTESSPTVVIRPEIIDTISNTKKPVVNTRQIRSTAPKHEQMEVDDPDDPQAVEDDNTKDPDFDPNSTEIVDDEIAAQFALPGIALKKAPNNTMVMHNRPTTSSNHRGSLSRTGSILISPAMASVHTSSLDQKGSSARVSSISLTPARASGQSSTAIIHRVSSPIPRSADVFQPCSDVVSPTQEVPPLSQVPRSTPLKIATPTNPMPVAPGWGGEMPIKSKCSQCPDKTSETMEQLVHHYSFMHYREEIEEKYIREGDNCIVCNEEFKLKFNLIKHLGLVHGAVKVDISQTQRWICNFCKKEFLSDEFLRKHLIKLHLEKKFESSFLALSESNEILCQFCEKTFSYKRNLFCHIGVDHDKLSEILPNYNKNDNADDLKCRHCDFESSLSALKTHYLTTHYKDSFASMCKEEGLLAADLSCKYCQVIFSDQDSLVLHIGVDHNRIFRFISHFQGKNINIVSNNKNTGLNAIAVKLPASVKKDPTELVSTDMADPLSTETVFVDTDQDISIESPSKPHLRIISPTKLLCNKSNILKSSTHSLANNNSPKGPQTKKQQVASPRADPKLKRQDTSKWCRRCSKNFLASKFEAHIILKHLSQVAVSELKKEQTLVSCHGLTCPHKACVKSNKFINMESLLVHHVTEHSTLLQTELAKAPDQAIQVVQSKSRTPNNVELSLDISNDGEDFQKTIGNRTTEAKQVPNSPWMEKFKTFCKISSVPAAKTMLNSKMKTLSPIVLEKFLTHLCQSPSIIPQLEEVTSALSSMFPNDSINTLPSVVRHLLLLEYQNYCSTVGTTMQVCNPMQVVIMLSQQLAKPSVKPGDLEWLVRWVSKLHDKVDGKLLIENKKITEFFEAVGFKLSEAEEVQEKTAVQVKQEIVEKPSFPCEKCATKFNKRIGLVRHRERCGDSLVVAKQKVTEHAAKLVSEEETGKVESAKEVAAKFKAKRISLGLGQKQVLVHMKSLLGPELKVQAIDVAKFELNHNQQAMTKFLPLAQSWLKMVPNQHHSSSKTSEVSSHVQVKTEHVLPTTDNSSSNSDIVSTAKVSSAKLVESSIPKVDIVKLNLSPSDFTSTIDLGSSPGIVQEPRERERLKSATKTKVDASVNEVDMALALSDIPEAEPECIDLDEEEKVYRYFCLECEGCAGSGSCDHTSHPRVPLQFDISTHIAKTGHVAVSPITGFLSLSPMSDLAYSMKHGADVRKQWKDLVLAGSYIPSQFTGVKRCKWADCQEIFEDAVEAFKHIRDTHLKPKQLKVHAAPVKSPLKQQLQNSGYKRKSLPPPSSSVPARKFGRQETNH